MSESLLLRNLVLLSTLIYLGLIVWHMILLTTGRLFEILGHGSLLSFNKANNVDAYIFHIYYYLLLISSSCISEKAVPFGAK